MRKVVFLFLAVAVIVSCKTTAPVKKLSAYSGMYNERPLSILIMPPINKSTNVEAKEFFHTTLLVPVANSGYYVIPPFMSMEILKKESAYDAELFLDKPLSKFGEIFGADMVLFTVINKWNKSSIGAKVTVGVEYIIKSTKTNETLYHRTGEIVYDASIRSNSGGLAGLVVSMAASAINTAATNYVKIARTCNAYTLYDLPQGKYSPKNMVDSAELAGKASFSATLR
ncbi:MAG TPA: GNA1162 family protein [Bacteroidales bacterium]|nr:GNA1162 family protein [Bacteroidales bacterium]